MQRPEKIKKKGRNQVSKITEKGREKEKKQTKEEMKEEKDKGKGSKRKKNFKPKQDKEKMLYQVATPPRRIQCSIDVLRKNVRKKNKKTDKQLELEAPIPESHSIYFFRGTPMASFTHAYPSISSSPNLLLTLFNRPFTISLPPSSSV